MNGKYGVQNSIVTGCCNTCSTLLFTDPCIGCDCWGKKKCKKVEPCIIFREKKCHEEKKEKKEKKNDCECKEKKNDCGKKDNKKEKKKHYGCKKLVKEYRCIRKLDSCCKPHKCTNPDFKCECDKYKKKKPKKSDEMPTNMPQDMIEEFHGPNPFMWPIKKMRILCDRVFMEVPFILPKPKKVMYQWFKMKVSNAEYCPCKKSGPHEILEHKMLEGETSDTLYFDEEKDIKHPWKDRRYVYYCKTCYIGDTPQTESKAINGEQVQSVPTMIIDPLAATSCTYCHSIFTPPGPPLFGLPPGPPPFVTPPRP